MSQSLLGLAVGPTEHTWTTGWTIASGLKTFLFVYLRSPEEISDIGSFLYFLFRIDDYFTQPHGVGCDRCYLIQRKFD